MQFDYVGIAYAVFAIVLTWDYIAPRVRLAQVRREVALRQRRDTARKRP
jgi:heme exporter protein D